MGLNLGIIGYGGMAGWHHENAARVPGVKVVAAYDIDPERVALAREKGLRGYDTLEAFLADEEINCVLVATPNDKHCELVCAALNAGKNAISEKPVALTVAEVDRMIKTAQDKHLLFTVHQNRRWDRDYLTVKEVLKQGTLGKVYSIQSKLTGSGGVMHGWRGIKKHGGGMLYDWGVHFIDQLYDLLGYDAFSTVYCVQNTIKNTEIDDYFFLILEGKDGLRVQVEIGTFILHDTPRWLVCGDEGSLIVNDFLASGKISKVNTMMEDVPVIVMTDAGPTRTFAPRPKEVKLELELPVVKGEWTDYYKNIIDVIDNGAEPIVKTYQIRRVLQTMEAAFLSSATGKVVEL